MAKTITALVAEEMISSFNNADIDILGDDRWFSFAPGEGQGIYFLIGENASVHDMEIEAMLDEIVAQTETAVMENHSIPVTLRAEVLFANTDDAELVIHIEN